MAHTVDPAEWKSLQPKNKATFRIQFKQIYK